MTNPDSPDTDARTSRPHPAPSGQFAERIVVGTDGSADAATAVGVAGDLAAQLGAEVILVHAVSLLERLSNRDVEPSVAVRDHVERLLETEWAEPLRIRTVPYRTIMEDGPPLLALPRVAQRESAALIVVASHGEGGDRLRRLGSTSYGLVRQSSHPVLVVPCRPQHDAS